MFASFTAAYPAVSEGDYLRRGEKRAPTLEGRIFSAAWWVLRTRLPFGAESPFNLGYSRGAKAVFTTKSGYETNEWRVFPAGQLNPLR